jgi:hypothetical protein
MTESPWRICRRRKGTGVNYREELAMGMVRLGLSVPDICLVTGYSPVTIRKTACFWGLHLARRMCQRAEVVVSSWKKSPASPRVTITGGVLYQAGLAPGDRVEVVVTGRGELAVRRVS